MLTKDWQGNQLDKDILNPGNKEYSPDNCIFVTQDINLLLNSRAKCRGKYPQGVSRYRTGLELSAELTANKSM